jgi:hypothetical protein
VYRQIASPILPLNLSYLASELRKRGQVCTLAHSSVGQLRSQKNTLQDGLSPWNMLYGWTWASMSEFLGKGGKGSEWGLRVKWVDEKTYGRRETTGPDGGDVSTSFENSIRGWNELEQKGETG